MKSKQVKQKEAKERLYKRQKRGDEEQLVIVLDRGGSELELARLLSKYF